MKNTLLHFLAAFFTTTSAQPLLSMDLKDILYDPTILNLISKRPLEKDKDTECQHAKSIEEIFSQYESPFTDEPALLFQENSKILFDLNNENELLDIYEYEPILNKQREIQPRLIQENIQPIEPEIIPFFIPPILSPIKKENLTCDACHTIIRTGLALYLYIHQHHVCSKNPDKKPLTCMLCFKENFTNHYGLIAHILRCPANPTKQLISCTFCLKNDFKTKVTLHHHMKHTCLNNDNRIILACHQCQKTNFSSPSALQQHIKDWCKKNQ